MKMRRPTRSAGGHRREGKATCHGCERPTQTKRRRRPAAETAQCINRMARRALLPARPGTCPTGKNAQAICKYASNARLDFSYRMHCRRNCSSRARTLHHPAPTIPLQRPAVLRAILRPATAPVRRNQLHPSRRKRPVQRIALPGLVAHQPLRNLPCQHEIEPPLCQSRLMRPGRTALHRNRQSPGVHGNEDLHPLAHLRAPDPVASTTCRTKRRIRKAFIQSILPRSSTSCPASCNSRSNTPSRTQRWKAWWTTLLEPNRRGRSFHLAPCSNNQKMPASALCLSVRGRPPLGFLGRSGMRAHNQSNSLSVRFTTTA